MDNDRDRVRRRRLPTAFGGLLRHWRTVQRLSQLELALVADVSQRHLSFLESGRSRPSREMVLRLGEALRIAMRERNALLHAAGFPAAFHDRGLAEPGMGPVRDALELFLHHQEPYPTLVVDRDWNLLMANEGLSGVLDLFGGEAALFQATCGRQQHNLYRLSFHRQGLRPYIANWNEVAPQLLQRLMRETARSGSAFGQTLLNELLADPALPREWQSPVVDEQPNPVLPLQLAPVGLRLSLLSVISTFGTPLEVATDELRIESFFPADARTAEQLSMLCGVEAQALRR